MTATTERVHPIRAAVSAANAAVVEVGEVDPVFMRTTDQVSALRELAALESRTAELKARILVALDESEVVAEAGVRDLPAWLDRQTRIGIRAAREEVAFARRLSVHPLTATAMRAGQVSQPQARVILQAVEVLPDDLDFDLPGDAAQRAECQLLADAGSFDPRALRVLGDRILDVVAPDIAEAAEARKLEAAERRARQNCRLSLRRVGDGTTRVSGRIPDLYAQMLVVMLAALLNPRRTPPWAGVTETDDIPPTGEAGDPAEGRAPPEDEPAEPVGPWWALPAPYRLGQAFCELLATMKVDDLPVHGTTAATLFITIPLDRLESGLGSATILGDGGEERISAGEARRLACGSGLIPAVLGSKSEVLDLGRTSRLFTAAQKKALLLSHPRCQAAGCMRPASQAEVHHDTPWSVGGATDLKDAIVFCVFHHHLAHDALYTYLRHPDGVVTFTRH